MKKPMSKNDLYLQNKQKAESINRLNTIIHTTIDTFTTLSLSQKKEMIDALEHDFLEKNEHIQPTNIQIAHTAISPEIISPLHNLSKEKIATIITVLKNKLKKEDHEELIDDIPTEAYQEQK